MIAYEKGGRISIYNNTSGDTYEFNLIYDNELNDIEKKPYFEHIVRIDKNQMFFLVYTPSFEGAYFDMFGLYKYDIESKQFEKIKGLKNLKIRIEAPFKMFLSKDKSKCYSLEAGKYLCEYSIENFNKRIIKKLTFSPIYVDFLDEYTQ